MYFCSKSVVACLSVFALAAIIGCGGDDSGEGGGETTPTTSISGTSPTGTPSAETVAQAGGTITTTAVAPPKVDLHPKVIIQTSLGNITIELDAENAPRTTDNFLMYVDDGHYEQTIFHEVHSNHPRLVIGGAYTKELVEKQPTWSGILSEAHNGLKNDRGTIAMARRPDIVDSATCHFFLNVADNDVLNFQNSETADGYGYCVFGKVVGGLDVLDKLGALEVHDTDKFEQIPADLQAATIESIRRVP